MHRSRYCCLIFHTFQVLRDRKEEIEHAKLYEIDPVDDNEESTMSARM